MTPMDRGADNDTYMRETSTYTKMDEPFLLSAQKYSRQQYSHIYFQRLIGLRKILREKSKKTWPSLQVQGILDLQEGVECVVIGTLYKHMKLHPSILSEYSKERSHTPLVTLANFVDEDDYLILEDEGGRMRLAGNCVHPGSFVTGVVLAVKGRELPNGEFGVEDILVPGLPLQTNLLQDNSQTSSQRQVAMVSGLLVGGQKVDPLQGQLLIDHLTGHLGTSVEHKMSASVVRIVIAGNSVGLPEEEDHLSNPVLEAREARLLAGPLGELDVTLTQLVASMPVDLMPGSSDPANFALPQQPLHPCLLPGTRGFETLIRATNPHGFTLDGVRFLGTSGQNVDDMRKYMTVEDPLDLLEKSLNWRHLAPTAPDTLGCYPFVDRDPFIIDDCPHVYFCGNQPKFASKIIKGSDGQQVRLICIPRFAETGQAVLVDLSNLHVSLVSVSTTLIN